MWSASEVCCERVIVNGNKQLTVCLMECEEYTIQPIANETEASTVVASTSQLFFLSLREVKSHLLDTFPMNVNEHLFNYIWSVA